MTGMAYRYFVWRHSTVNSLEKQRRGRYSRFGNGQSFADSKPRLDQVRMYAQTPPSLVDFL
jgi:hypothetical protein